MKEFRQSVKSCRSRVNAMNLAFGTRRVVAVQPAKQRPQCPTRGHVLTTTRCREVRRWGCRLKRRHKPGRQRGDLDVGGLKWRATVAPRSEWRATTEYVTTCPPAQQGDAQMLRLLLLLLLMLLTAGRRPSTLDPIERTRPRTNAISAPRLLASARAPLSDDARGKSAHG